MTKSMLQRRALILSGSLAVALLIVGGAWFGLAKAFQQQAQAGAEPTTSSAIKELARRFKVPADKQLQLQAVFALTGGEDMRQSLRDTAVALERSNAETDLLAPPAPTGDALFDRYALAVDGRINAANAGKTNSQDKLAALSDADLAQWESEFGGDVRYWELRYLCALNNAGQTPLSAGFAKPGDFLDEASRRNIATANTLLVRYRELCMGHEAELKPFEPKRQPQGAGESGASPAAPPPLDPQAASIIKRQQQEQLALLDAAVAAAPEMAWPRYMRGLYWLERGEQAKGLKDLAAGNAAPDCPVPQPWPLGCIADAPAQAVPPGSAAVCGEIYMLGFEYQPFKTLHLRQTMSDSLACIKPGGDLSALETWQLFNCRYALGAPLNYLTSITGNGRICTYMEEHLASNLAPEQIETLQRCRGAREAFKAARHNSFFYDGIGSSVALIPFAGFRALAVGMYLELSVDWQTFHSGEQAQVFSDLSQVQFPDLAMPECMRKYEAISLEESRRRSEERRAKNKLASEAQAKR
jgi:hypothetical protein